jgi:hypothetical protein
MGEVSMKRVMLALAITVLVAVGAFVGSAAADVRNVSIVASSTEITVNGVEVGCDDVEQGGAGSVTVRIRLYDENDNLLTTKSRSVNVGHKWFPAAVFTGLEPGTTYRVAIEDNSCEGFVEWFDESVTTLAAGAAPGAIPQGPDRYIFCAVAGNTDVNGNPIAPGTSLNLEPDQVTGDEHYKGATIGFFVAGLGATCQLTPAQAALAAASTTKVNHVGGTGDYNQPEIYTFIG